VTKRLCKNCGREVGVRTEKEGLTHLRHERGLDQPTGTYGCQDRKDKVAE